MKTKHIVDGVQPSEGAIHPKNRDELSIALSDVLDPDKVVVPIGCLLYTSDAADE